MSYKRCLIAYIRSKKSFDLIAHAQGSQGSSDDWRLQITKYKTRITKYKSPTHREARDLLRIGNYKLQNTKYKIQNTHYKLQIAHREARDPLRIATGRVLRKRRRRSTGEGRRPTRARTTTIRWASCSSTILSWHLSVVPGLPQWDGSWWRKVCSRKGCGELKTAILSSWRKKKHCTFPGSRARSVFKLGGEDCGPRERLLGAPPLHRGHPDAAISLAWSSSWSWLWPPCWYMVLRLHGLRACYRYM